MKRKMYVLYIHTEELMGRMSATRDVRCFTLEDAEKALEREYNILARRHRLTVDEDINDFCRVVEYAPKMRTTLLIKEA